MDKPILNQALRDMEFNVKRAQMFPDNQKEFYDEYMNANPNDFEEMKELYTYYGYRYSRSLWALQQLSFQEAHKAETKRLNKTDGRVGR